jgi:peptide/nickel transport system substrate-binding protein
MSDPYVDKTWEEVVKDPNLTEKQASEKMRNLIIYILDQAPAISLPVPYYYTAWWPWVKNYQGEVRVGAQRSAPIMARIWMDEELKKNMGY